MFFILAALGSVVPRLLRGFVTEGQIEKQNFVVHLSESMRWGELEHGFPLRFFVELWHPGPLPWAEEFPLYHALTAVLSWLLGIGVVQAGRGLSFFFALLSLWGIHRAARRLFAPSSMEPWLATALLAAFPGFQLYSVAVMPDLAMTSLLMWALVFLLEGRKGLSLLAGMLACLFKYFAVFGVGALCLFEFWRARGLRERTAVLARGTLAVAPVIAFVGYFVAAGIPNPITEYRAGNGYGHLAGPFLLNPHFYQRMLLWIFVKGPGLPGGLLFLAGMIFGARREARPEARLDGKLRDWADFTALRWFLCFELLFALVFASSFYVHDYYALPFLIPAALYGAAALGSIRHEVLPLALMGVVLLFGVVGSQTASRPDPNLLAAAEEVREALRLLPDRGREAQVLYGIERAVAPIPVLAKKSGWTFSLAHTQERPEDLRRILANPGLQAVVLYAQEGEAPRLFSELQALDPFWDHAGERGHAKVLLQKTLADARGGRDGAPSASRLLILGR